MRHLGKCLSLAVWLVVGLSGGNSYAFFQQESIMITGNVSDIDGLPLPGATFLEKGTNNGSQSDFDGLFTIEVSSEQAVLVFRTLE